MLYSENLRLEIGQQIVAVLILGRKLFYYENENRFKNNQRTNQYCRT